MDFREDGADCRVDRGEDGLAGKRDGKRCGDLFYCRYRIADGCALSLGFRIR